MGRPRKTETGSPPTRERLLSQALELFAERGYDGVSVRQIVAPLGLTEAALYNHYSSKAELLEEIFARFEENLIRPGLLEGRAGEEGMAIEEAGRETDVVRHLVQGATAFFARADRSVRLTWRVLMISQYSNETARTAVESHVLRAPERFFGSMLERFRVAGALKPTADTASLGRVVASVFFLFSFRANLSAAWGEGYEFPQDQIERDLRAALSGAVSVE